jgi:hypothetical protein
MIFSAVSKGCVQPRERSFGKLLRDVVGTVVNDLGKPCLVAVCGGGSKLEGNTESRLLLRFLLLGQSS